MVKRKEAREGKEMNQTGIKPWWLWRKGRRGRPVKRDLLPRYSSEETLAEPVGSPGANLPVGAVLISQESACTNTIPWGGQRGCQSVTLPRWSLNSVPNTCHFCNIYPYCLNANNSGSSACPAFYKSMDNHGLADLVGSWTLSGTGVRLLGQFIRKERDSKGRHCIPP